jgi:hypothetical protein
MNTTAKLTNLQLELIKIFSFQLNDNQLIEIRDILTKYFAENATKEMDKLWLNNGWTNETMENWANEHMRTTYNLKQ